MNLSLERCNNALHVYAKRKIWPLTATVVAGYVFHIHPFGWQNERQSVCQCLFMAVRGNIFHRNNMQQQQQQASYRNELGMDGNMRRRRIVYTDKIV